MPDKEEIIPWEVGRLVRVREDHKPGFVQIHPHFVQPRQIWEPLKIFWRKKSNIRYWGNRGQNDEPRMPTTIDEWITALKMECAWELGDKGIHQRDIAKRQLLEGNSILMCTEVVVTPWKKRYRFAGGSVRRQRFSYVKLLATVNDVPMYLYRDISEWWDTRKIETWIFDVLA